jgi:hypothetical protein
MQENVEGRKTLNRRRTQVFEEPTGFFDSGLGSGGLHLSEIFLRMSIPGKIPCRTF